LDKFWWTGIFTGMDVGLLWRNQQVFNASEVPTIM